MRRHLCPSQWANSRRSRTDTDNRVTAGEKSRNRERERTSSTHSCGPAAPGASPSSTLQDRCVCWGGGGVGVGGHTVRGTKPGEVAAGDTVMAVRVPGFSPFAFLLHKHTNTHSEGRSAWQDNNNMMLLYNNTESRVKAKIKAFHSKDSWFTGNKHESAVVLSCSLGPLQDFRKSKLQKHFAVWLHMSRVDGWASGWDTQHCWYQQLTYFWFLWNKLQSPGGASELRGTDDEK